MPVQAYPRYRYVVSAIVFIDLPLWIEARHRDWVLVGASLFVMLVLTVARMREIGWDQIWAVPYCFWTVSPLSFLYLRPTLSPWIAFACIAALQTPVMAWPASESRKASIEDAASSRKSAGWVAKLMELVTCAAVAWVWIFWVAPDNPGHMRREVFFLFGLVGVTGLYAVWRKRAGH